MALIDDIKRILVENENELGSVEAKLHYFEGQKVILIEQIERLENIIEKHGHHNISIDITDYAVSKATAATLETWLTKEPA